jgi:hypothetical protein
VEILGDGLFGLNPCLICRSDRRAGSNPLQLERGADAGGLAELQTGGLKLNP